MWNLRSPGRVANALWRVLFSRHKLSDMHDIKEVVKADTLNGDNPDEKKEAAKAVRKAFMARYQAGSNPWFFSKLRF